MSFNSLNVSNLNASAAAAKATADATVAVPASTSLASFLTTALAGAGPLTTFSITSTQDTSDTALAIAKGSALSVGDVFAVTESGMGVRYIAPSTVQSSLANIAAYITAPTSSESARRNHGLVSQKFNELVAALNAFSA